MFTASRRTRRLGLGSQIVPLCTLALVSVGQLAAAGLGEQDSTAAKWLDVEFPHDSPILPIRMSLQEPSPTTATVRGASLVIDLHASLVLRNTGTKTLSSMTLGVESPDLTPSVRGSVTIPSLHAQPGAVFPVRVDMQLQRPLNMGRSRGAMMQVSLDCALFSDLSSYGPDKLHSRRTLMVYELEARRDRRYLASLLETGRAAELRSELNFGLQDLNPAQLGFELLHSPDGRRSGREQPVTIAAVAFPSAPVRALGGNAEISGNQVSASRLQVRNTTTRAVKNFEIGWIVRDERGRDFVAGSMPSPIQLAPVETADMTQPGLLRFSRPGGQPMIVDGLLAFVNDVEFWDGKLWIPSRSDINAATNDPVLRRALAASPEEQRLADVYRHRGTGGLLEELNKTR